MINCFKLFVNKYAILYTVPTIHSHTIFTLGNVMMMHLFSVHNYVACNRTASVWTNVLTKSLMQN